MFIPYWVLVTIYIQNKHINTTLEIMSDAPTNARKQVSKTLHVSVTRYTQRI